MKKTQYELQCEMQQKGINIVSCGRCGSILLHESPHEGELTCPDCGFESDPCDFPDLNYQENEWELIDNRKK